jgi:phage/plasmid-like protein (TIGR03299 family)
MIIKEREFVGNWSDALDYYGLNYKVEKRPLYLSNGQEIENLYSIVRTDTNEPLSGVAVNKRYQCIQTQSYADIGNKIMNDLNVVKFVRGGILMHGKGLFMQAKLPDTIRVKTTNDTIDKLLTFVTSHDGTMCFTVVATALRLICTNQMLALNEDIRHAGYKVRHTTSADFRLQEANLAIMNVLNAYKVFEQKVNFLADKRITDLQMNLVTKKLFNAENEEKETSSRTNNAIEIVKNLFEHGKGNDQWRGTAWGAYNAMTEYADHFKKMRGEKDRFESNLVGSSMAFKVKALNIIEQVIS